jgi:tryptophanyl-tRNA synthetase
VRIFSGIQPTGQKHLGNYIGAIRSWVEGQHHGEAIYCIVDLHATTVAYDPSELRASVVDTTAMLLAAGLDPDACILFRQGDVVEHTELCWLLCAVCAFGDLNRMHQFKEKAGRQRELVSAGLFFYPVLQAADILCYNADAVPVGDDQLQHIELARDIAQRFNERFGDTFTLPAHRTPALGARIMDLQKPTQKMSTTGSSDAGTLYVLDEPDRIAQKIKSAVTDSGTEIVRKQDKPGISNLIELMAAVQGLDPAQIESEYSQAGYGQFKNQVAECVVEYLRPLRQRYAELRADQDSLESVLSMGSQRAHAIASKTLEGVRARMGVGPVS